MPTAEFARFLRINATAHERLLWAALRDRRCGGILFEMQVPLMGWVADFLAPDVKLIVEVDGPGHEYGRQKHHDAVRDRVLASQGYTTLRVSNNQVAHCLPAVVRLIEEAAKRR